MRKKIKFTLDLIKYSKALEDNPVQGVRPLKLILGSEPKPDAQYSLRPIQIEYLELLVEHFKEQGNAASPYTIILVAPERSKQGYVNKSITSWLDRFSTNTTHQLNPNIDDWFSQLQRITELPKFHTKSKTLIPDKLQDIYERNRNTRKPLELLALKIVFSPPDSKRESAKTLLTAFNETPQEKEKVNKIITFLKNKGQISALSYLNNKSEKCSDPYINKLIKETAGLELLADKIASSPTQPEKESVAQILLTAFKQDPPNEEQLKNILTFLKENAEVDALSYFNEHSRSTINSLIDDNNKTVQLIKSTYLELLADKIVSSPTESEKTEFTRTLRDAFIKPPSNKEQLQGALTILKDDKQAVALSYLNNKSAKYSDPDIKKLIKSIYLELLADKIVSSPTEPKKESVAKILFDTFIEPPIDEKHQKKILNFLKEKREVGTFSYFNEYSGLINENNPETVNLIKSSYLDLLADNIVFSETESEKPSMRETLFNTFIEHPIDEKHQKKILNFLKEKREVDTFSYFNEHSSLISNPSIGDDNEIVQLIKSSYLDLLADKIESRQTESKKIEFTNKLLRAFKQTPPNNEHLESTLKFLKDNKQVVALSYLNNPMTEMEITDPNIKLRIEKAYKECLHDKCQYVAWAFKNNLSLHDKITALEYQYLVSVPPGRSLKKVQRHTFTDLQKLKANLEIIRLGKHIDSHNVKLFPLSVQDIENISRKNITNLTETGYEQEEIQKYIVETQNSSLANEGRAGRAQRAVEGRLKRSKTGMSTNSNQNSSSATGSPRI